MMIMIIDTYVDRDMKTMFTIRDPVKSQKNKAQSGDEDVNVDCEHINMRGVW